MRSLALRVLLLAAIVTTLASAAQSHQTHREKLPSGSISGRVRVGDLPARGVTVLLLPSESGAIERPSAKATTDQDGHYHLTGVPAGQYFLQAFAPSFIGASDSISGREGKSINLIEGEAVVGIDIDLRPGGVITGRVTDADGQPLVQENVRLFKVEQGRKVPFYPPYSYMMSFTDDRGVYRMFGLPPGRYIIGAGVDTSAPNARMNAGSTYYSLAYHPDVTDEARAIAIEVAAGSETTGVDIVLGRPSKAFFVSGRIVDGYTGKPVVGMMYGYGGVDPQSGRLNVTSITSSTSNAKGEFRLEGVTPGRYSAFAFPSPDSEFYSDTATFTITDSDVTGLVVKVHSGSSIVGAVFIEGLESKPGAPRLSDIRVSVHSGSITAAPRSNLVRIAPDGSFRVGGLPRGTANISLVYPAPKGLALIRVERDGIEQKNGIEVGGGEEISGVKIVFGYGTGTIRGQVKVEDGEIPPGAFMSLSIRRVGAPQFQSYGRPGPDSRGRFTIDGLQPGDYELTLYFQSRPSTPIAGGPQIVSRSVKQTVTVSNGVDTQVTMVVDLNSKDR